MVTLHSIDLTLAQRLRDREFRHEWFRGALEDSVPEQFRDLREYRNYTQSELATLANMKQSAISRFEVQRIANWKFETLLRLADALDAQLVIKLERAEDVITRYEREEVGSTSGPKSVLEAESAGEFNPWEPSTLGLAVAAKDQFTTGPTGTAVRGAWWS